MVDMPPLNLFGEGGFFSNLGIGGQDLFTGALGLALGGPIPGLLGLAGSSTIRNIRGSNEQLEDITASTTEALQGVSEQQAGILDRLPITFPGGNLSASFLENVGVDLEDLEAMNFGPVELGPGDTKLFSPSQVEAATGRALFSTEGLFDSAQRQLDFLRANPLPTSLDVDVEPTRAEITSGFESMIANLLGLGDVARSEFANVELPETDLSEILTARLAGAGAASGIRERQAQGSLTSTSSALGGLENLRRASGQLSFQEAGQRALESAGIVGQTRAEELARQELRSNLQRDIATGIMEAEQAGVTGAGTLQGQLGGILERLLGLETGISTVETGLEIAALEREMGLVGGVEDQRLAEMLFNLDQQYRSVGSEQDILRDIFGTEAGLSQLLLAGQSQETIPDIFSMLYGVME